MTPTEIDTAAMDRLVDEHFAFEATDDVDGVVATLAEDATHHLVGSPSGPLIGRDRIRTFYEELFATLRGEHVEPVDRWHGDGLLVDESMWTGHIADARLFGLPGRSGLATFRLLHVFELRGDTIATEKVWSDLAAIDRSLS